ncbi:hypothetical protein Ciccas_010581 [Cichlidogyrus casuarinus]|uniref:Protein kinase domain-containing protein n=1 Tax=Cichlidogyrus casuarinus TaxID=1844966 RepID=A0ABD2PTQ8_9PLAT
MESNTSFLDGFWGCLKPVFNFFGTSSNSSVENWVYHFESITDLQFRGAGSQGAVFSGRLGEQVIAVKKVHKAEDVDIAHLRRLQHPNVIKFIGVCVESPCFCVLMELCPYGHLFEMIHHSNLELRPENLADWAMQIAQGMDYLHEIHDIIHRDLKSPNVLIGADHNLKISDFGHSKAGKQGQSMQMSFAGTFAWMAPEIIRSEPCSSKVDVWSFGVILWELLTGKIPYEGVDSTAIIWGVGSEKLCLPLPMTCPTEMRVLIKRCCMPNAKDRPRFNEILRHLDLANKEFLDNYSGDRFTELKASWTKDIAVQFECLRKEGVTVQKLDDHLIKMRRSELKHAQDIRKHYIKKVKRVDQLYQELQMLISQTQHQHQPL